MKRTILLAVIAILGLAGAARACPFCKDSAPDASTLGGQPVTAGSPYNLSIFVMLGGLFAVMGFVGRNVVKAIQTADAANAAVVPNAPRPDTSTAAAKSPNSAPTDIRIG